MASQGTIQEYSTLITDDIDDFYSKNKYIEFKPDPMLIMNNNLPSLTKRSQLKLMTKMSEYDTDAPIKMTLFDNNLYNIDTATYNTCFYFSKNKKEEQELIRSGSTVINETEGLRYIFKSGYLITVEDFLKSKYNNSSQTESFVSGLSVSNTADTENDKNMSFIDMIANNFKLNIWNYDNDNDNDNDNNNNNNNNNTITEGMDFGLTYKSYSGYVDSQVSDKSYFNNKQLKTNNGNSIIGTATNFSDIGIITGSKVSGSTEYTMTTLSGYLYTNNNAGNWTFSINSDDMSLLIIADTNGVTESNDFNSSQVKLKIDNRGLHGMSEKTGTVNLVANKYYKIYIVTGNNAGPGNLIFKFKPPGFTVWQTTADGYFYTTIPKSSFASTTGSTAIKSVDNSATLAKLYESAKKSALSAVSSITASASVKKSNVFVMANPDVPDELLTLFPTISSGNNQITKNGQFNSLDWSKISPKSELSVEWFGYLKANVSGTYYIKIASNRQHISNVWIGDNALVNYTQKNADINNYGSLDSTGMYLSGDQERTTNEIKVVAGQYYPVRIQYSQTSHTVNLYNFNVYILKLNGDGSKTEVGSSDAYFCSLTDNKNISYEPIQLAMALRNDKNEANPILFNCYVSPINISNNYINNENLRKVRGQDSKIFKSFNLTPKDTINKTGSSLTLTSNGDLVFNNGISVRSITGNNLTDDNGSVKNSNCNNLCNLPDYNTRGSIIVPGAPTLGTDVGIYNLSVKEKIDGNGEELLGNFVDMEQTEETDTESGIKYTKISLTVDKKEYDAYYKSYYYDTGMVVKESFTEGFTEGLKMKSISKAFKSAGKAISKGFTEEISKPFVANVVKPAAAVLAPAPAKPIPPPPPPPPAPAPAPFVPPPPAPSISVPKTETLGSCYVFYTIGKNGSKKTIQFKYDSQKQKYTQSIDNYAEAKALYLSIQSSSKTPFEKYKQDYQNAIDIDAQNCINDANEDCSFYAGISNNGEIFIAGAMGNIIWKSTDAGRLMNNLGSLYILPTLSSLKPVKEWIIDADKLKNYYIYSASYANPFDTTPFKSMSIGKGQTYEVLYSPNGKYKLTLENGVLELKCAINGDNYINPCTNNDGSQSFMLHMIMADEKIGGVYLANTQDKTIYEMKNDKDKILKYANTFSNSTVKADYQYPPYNSGSTAINSTSYNKTLNSKDSCEKICINTDACTHYYSYTTNDNKTWCMVNNDKSPELYYNKIPELKNSNLYIRDKMLDSTCSYSEDRCGKYKNVSLLTNSGSNTNDTYTNYNKDYNVIYSRDLKYGQNENPSSEGACGSSRIYSRLANLVGPEEKVGEYKFNNMSCSKEGFSPVLPSTFSPLLQSDVTKVTEGFNVTGYIESNSCKMVNEYVNSIDVNPETYSSMIQNCKTDLLKNAAAIENYWTEFNNDNNKINTYYNDITTGVVDVNKKDAIINNDSITPKTVNYDSIDFSGNLLLTDTLKNATSLKDGRIKDERENITQEMTMYLISIMALIAIFIFLIFVTSFE
jgi:hypothetical protein